MLYLQCVNSIDPDQAQHFVGPDLGPDYLQRLWSAADTSMQRIQIESIFDTVFSPDYIVHFWLFWRQTIKI